MHFSQLFTRGFWHPPFCAITHEYSTCKQSVNVSRQGFREVRLLMYADHLRSSTYTYLLSSCIYNLQLQFFSCYSERYIFQHTLNSWKKIMQTGKHRYILIWHNKLNWIKWSHYIWYNAFMYTVYKIWNSASKFSCSKSVQEFNK